MRLLSEQELAQHQPFIDAALELAKQSTCYKSKRGAVLVKDGTIIGRGWNRPPEGYPDREDYCSAICRTYTNHAEQVALLDALKGGNDVTGATMYHGKIKDGKQERVRGATCDQCHRITLEAGIGFWMLELAEGWTE